MSQFFPYKRIIRLNITLSLLLSALVSVILLTVGASITETLYRVAQAVLFTLIVTFTNTWLLERIYLGVHKAGKFSKFLYYFTSYVAALLFFACSVVFYTALSGNGWEGNSNKRAAWLLALLAICIFNTIVLVIQQLLISQDQITQNQIEKLQLKASIAESANLLLRQQIQPHFLFNALTVLKSVYKQDLRKGETYLVHLATFLRASLTNRTQTTALVKDELDFALNYLNMQKIRFGSAVISRIQIDEKVMQTNYLPYFSIQPLIENALKHNGFTEERPLYIEIFSEKGCIVVRNNRQTASFTEPSTGHGLYNLKERYNLLGIGHLDILADDGSFSVYLPLLDK